MLNRVSYHVTLPRVNFKPQFDSVQKEKEATKKDEAEGVTRDVNEKREEPKFTRSPSRKSSIFLDT